MPLRYLCVDESFQAVTVARTIFRTSSLSPMCSPIAPRRTCISISLVSCGVANSVSILVLMFASSPSSGEIPNMALAMRLGKSPSGGLGFM